MASASTAELISRLSEGIANLTTSSSWRSWLELQSRLHRYSYANVLLIAAQRPGATQVAGYRSWQKMHRYVRRGERAIWILAPVVARTEESAEVPVVRGFRSVPVFDVTQTDGEPLPSICSCLIGEDSGGNFERLVAVAANLGCVVEEHDFADGTNGDYTAALSRIRIERRNRPAQRVKSLVHELAHALLHDGTEERAIAELEAESIAFVVCSAIGIDSGDYSFGYVASWAGSGEEALHQLRLSCGRIQRNASVLIDALASVESPAPANAGLSTSAPFGAFLRAANDDDGTVSVGREVLAHGAEEHSGELAVTAASHYEQ